MPGFVAHSSTSALSLVSITKASSLAWLLNFQVSTKKSVKKIDSCTYEFDIFPSTLRPVCFIKCAEFEFGYKQQATIKTAFQEGMPTSTSTPHSCTPQTKHTNNDPVIPF